MSPERYRLYSDGFKEWSLSLAAVLVAAVIVLCGTYAVVRGSIDAETYRWAIACGGTLASLASGATAAARTLAKRAQSAGLSGRFSPPSPGPSVAE